MASDAAPTHGTVLELAGQRIFLCLGEGPALADERAAADLLGEAFSVEASVIAIPVDRLPPAFLDLRTRLAGEILQKLVNYGYRVAILGDISSAVAGSKALRDFVRESNRGRTVWFVADLAELEARLAQAPGA